MRSSFIPFTESHLLIFPAVNVIPEFILFFFFNEEGIHFPAISFVILGSQPMKYRETQNRTNTILGLRIYYSSSQAGKLNNSWNTEYSEESCLSSRTHQLPLWLWSIYQILRTKRIKLIPSNCFWSESQEYLQATIIGLLRSDHESSNTIVQRVLNLTSYFCFLVISFLSYQGPLSLHTKRKKQFTLKLYTYGPTKPKFCF